MEIKYIERYSDTSEPDKQGRWARKVMFKDLCIGWINRIDIEGDIVFSTSTFFPGSGNDRPESHAIKDSYQDAQNFIESNWNEFLEAIR